MSGHSKWTNIKRKKEKTDGQKAKVFTKVGREISVAVREGGGDPNSNGKLRDLIAKAKSLNVPNDNIQRIIKKAEGGEKDNYEPITYEGYGPCGIAMMVETLTDNRNRTAANLRHYFDKFGGNLGNMGCVSFMFTQKGVIVLDGEGLDEEKTMEDCRASGSGGQGLQLYLRRGGDGALHLQRHHRRGQPEADGQAAGRPGRGRRRAERLA